MNLLYSTQQSDTIDANGTEELTAADNPNWFAGTGTEVARGIRNIGIHAERVAGQMDSSAADALGVNRYITPDGSVKRITEIEPTAPEDLPKFEKPDHLNSGAAAVLLGELTKQIPTIGAAIINPLAGFAAGASIEADAGAEEAAERGLTGNDALAFTALRSLEGGVGGALPGIGGIGERAVLKYGSRFVIGGTVNTGLMQGFAWGRADVLEAAGFSAQAEQLRQWDTQAAMSSFVLGGFFNLAGGHARDRGEPGLRVDDVPPADATPEVNGPAPAPETAPIADVIPMTDPAATPLAGYKLSREDVKAAKSDLVNSQRHLDRLDAERQAVLDDAPKGSGKRLAESRAAQQAKLADIEAQRKYSQDINDGAAERLASHEAYNRQRIDAMHADAATHTVLHDNYVTESAPGLAVDALSEAAHVRAMDDTINAMQAGQAVDVSAHFSGEHGYLGAADMGDGIAARQEMAGDASAKMDEVVRAANEQAIPDGAAGAAPEPAPGVISEINQQPYETLRQQIESIRTTHPELADQMLPHVARLEAEHAQATKEAGQYDIAAACALTHGA